MTLAGRMRMRKLLLFGCLPVLILVVLAAALLWLTGVRAAPKAEASLLAAWEEGLGLIDDRFHQEFPARETNEDALALEKMAGPLGVELAPKWSRRVHTKGGLEGDLKKSIHDFLAASLEGVADAPPGAPRSLREFCGAHEKELAGLVEHLLSADPRWAFEPAKGADAPQPNLLGQINLQRILMACALVADGEGRAVEANRIVEAGWRLNQRLGERPELLSALIYTAALRMQAGTLRHLRAPDPEWLERLGRSDPVAAMVRGQRGEGRWMLLTSRALSRTLRANLGPGQGRPPALIPVVADNPVVGPWLRHGIYTSLEAYARLNREALEKAPCDFDFVGWSERLQDDAVGRNPMSRIGLLMLSNLPEAWARTRRAEIDVEAARRIIAFKGALAGGNGPRDWPDMEAFVAGRGLETVSVCPDGEWVYTIEGQPPSYVLRLEGPEVRSEISGFVAPLEQRIAMP